MRAHNVTFLLMGLCLGVGMIVLLRDFDIATAVGVGVCCAFAILGVIVPAFPLLFADCFEQSLHAKRDSTNDHSEDTYQLQHTINSIQEVEQGKERSTGVLKFGDRRQHAKEKQNKPNPTEKVPHNHPRSCPMAQAYNCRIRPSTKSKENLRSYACLIRHHHVEWGGRLHPVSYFTIGLPNGRISLPWTVLMRIPADV